MCFVLCIQKHHLRTFHQAAKGGHGTTKGEREPVAWEVHGRASQVCESPEVNEEGGKLDSQRGYF